MSALNRVDTVVVGAGVVGLAVARALTQRLPTREVLVLDRAGDFGTETSSRNSQVIHAGLYYPQGSFKERFCGRGKLLLYKYCQDHTIHHRQLGKLIVATQESELQGLKNLRNQGKRYNQSLRMLSQEDVRSLQPELRCVAALWSPETGILDVHQFMSALYTEASNKGTTFAFRSRVERIVADNANETPRITMVDGTILEASVVINCAGLWASQLDESLPKQTFCKGNYFWFTKAHPFHSLVYPMPNASGLGIHGTLDLDGRLRFGPDTEWLTCESPDEIDYVPNESRRSDFYDNIRRYWPDIPDGSLEPDYSGVRPKVESKDFEFLQHGRVLHCLGIESPGVTSSLAIAEYVTGVVAAMDP